MKRAIRLAASRSRAVPSKPGPSLQRRTFINPTASKEVGKASHAFPPPPPSSSVWESHLVLPVEITTLPNNIRVATEPTPGHFSSVGVYIDAGSRYESSNLTGCSHIMDRMAFKTTTNRSGEEMSSAVDSLGGQILCSSSRETIMYQSSHFHSATPTAVSLLADTVQNAAFLPEELETVRDGAAYEIREINAKPELVMPELLHQLAYQNNTLGNPLLCPEERLDVINGDILREYVKTWYRPERIVIAGAGMEHQELVDLAYKHFGDMKATASAPSPLLQPSASTNGASSSRTNPPTHLLPPSSPGASPSLYKTITTAATSLFHPSPMQTTAEPTWQELAAAKARYTGGHQFIYRPDLDMTHVYLGFDGLSIHDEDIYALATIQILLGGGGSFSAGGPGKGMYSRLYTHVLNLHSSIDHCSAFHHIYNDTSLFGLQLVSHAHHPVSSILPLLAHQLSLLLYHPIPRTELSRAKNQLMSSLVMALESRSVEVEDLGRQVLVHGRKVSVQEMCEKIARVDAADIKRVAGRIFGGGMSGPPSVLVMGKKEVGEWAGVWRKYGLGGL